MDWLYADREEPTFQPPMMRRAIYLWLLLFYLAFVVYGSLVPFYFAWRPYDDAVAAFAAIPFLQLGIGSRADWVANLLLFIPLTFLASLAFNQGNGAIRFILAILIILAGFALAVSVEFVQLYFPNRTVSQNDILAEGLGGMLGVISHSLWGKQIGGWIEALWQAENRQDRVIRLQHAYLFLLLTFNVLPLDLTLSPAELYHKWQQGRIILLPLGGLKGSWVDILYELGTDALIWVPVGLLWTLGGLNLATAIWRGLIVALVIEILQLFVYSRITDVTDVVLAVIGVSAGAFAGLAGRTKLALLAKPSFRAWPFLWWLWVALILGVFWFPYSFTIGNFELTTVWNVVTRPPLSTYYGTTEFHATNELLRKIGFFVPGGLLWGMWAIAKSAEVRLSRGLLPLAAIAFAVESGQLFIPGKVADLTDALFELTGAAIGLLICQWLRMAGDSRREHASGLIEQGRTTKSPASMQVAAPGRAIHILWPGLLALAIAAAVHLPGVPYNVRELIEPGMLGMLATLSLALAIYWMVNAPFIFLIESRLAFVAHLPIILVGHGLIGWLLLRIGAPLESIHDILGTPVLAWAWEWELIGRYLALHAAVVMQIVLAAWCILLMRHPSLLPRFLYLGVLALLFSWPLHSVVVSWAATDNLTELMGGGGGYAISSVLAAGLFFLALSGSAVSALMVISNRRKLLIATAMIAIFLAAAAFWFGAEQNIVKYGKVFSALQFLLSPDRAHYVSSISLVARFAFALALASIGLAILQLPAWRQHVAQATK